MIYNPHAEEAYKLLHDGVLALATAEQNGMRVDVEYIELKMKQLARKIERLEGEFKQTKFYRHWAHSRGGKINIHSNTQLAHYLYTTKKIKVEKETTSGQGATDEESLQKMGIPEIEDLLRIRKLKKVRDTYLESFLREQVDGYIHPFFNLNLVKTYRSSSDHPNFQNIPKRDEESMKIVRNALLPRPGHQLLELDYSGLEVRIAACYHKDPTMLTYLREGYDMHTDIAKQIYMLDNFDKSIPAHDVLRYGAKNGFVFPEFYGDYFGNCALSLACTWGKLPQGKWTRGQGIELDTENFTLSDHLIAKGISSLGQFTEHIKRIEDDFWGNRFPDYAQWKDRWWNTYKKYGYITTLTGFQCSGVMGKNDVINYPVQGSAFHCLLWSFIQLDRIIKEKGWDSRLIGQIHDSILIDINPNELEDIVRTVYKVTCKRLPKAWPWIIVPLDIDIELTPIDDSWAKKEHYEFKYFFV